MLFNTTGSEDAMLTALTVFPHGMRVDNNMMVSGAPLRFDVKRWIDRLGAVRLRGRPMLDRANLEHRKRIAELERFVDRSGPDSSAWGTEPRDRLLPRIRSRGAAVITDDNMRCEW
jgi:hypothetical protein